MPRRKSRILIIPFFAFSIASPLVMLAQSGREPAGGGKMLFLTRHSYNLYPTAETAYFSPIHIEEANSVGYDVVGVIPVPCTMTNMAIKVDDTLEAGVTVTFKLRKGTSIGSMADTALACAVTSAATFCTDTHAVSMDAGDLFTFEVTYDAGSSGPDNVFLTDLVCQ